jgi:S1-C subfamily serine protease
VRKRKIVRERQDSNGIWDDISVGERNDTLRWFRRSTSRGAFWLVTVIVAASFGAGVMAIVNLAIQQAELDAKQISVPDIVATVKQSTVAVSCGDFTGTGVAVTMPLPDKYSTGIISAAHIFEQCAEGDKVTVTYKGREYEALLAKKDPASGAVGTGDEVVDLALLLLTAKFPSLEPAPEARQGDLAIVVGNPWDETNYVTVGVVSDMTIDTYLTDAAVNEGNSGGPMLDSHGRVLGIASHGPIMSDLYEENPAGIYDRAEGITVFQRLRLSCEHLFAGAPACPFAG